MPDCSSQLQAVLDAQSDLATASGDVNAAILDVDSALVNVDAAIADLKQQQQNLKAARDVENQKQSVVNAAIQSYINCASGS